MFATGGPRCPVKLLKTFLSHRPEEIESSGPIYLAVIERPNSQVWYKRQRMGIHNINSYLRSMADQAETDAKGSQTTMDEKRWRRNSVKAALSKPRSVFIGATGHTNERSLADYGNSVENEQRLIFSIISSDSQVRTANQRRPLRNIGLSSTMANTLTLNEEAVDDNQQPRRLSSYHQLLA